MRTLVLDACALIAYLRNEKGAKTVQQQINHPRTRAVIHAVNFYEVFYDTYRQQPGLASLVAEFAKKTDIDIVQRLDRRLMEEAARLKTSYSMSMADSLALGLALKLDATLLTADRHEFGDIARAGVVKIKFIR